MVLPSSLRNGLRVWRESSNNGKVLFFLPIPYKPVHLPKEKRSWRAEDGGDESWRTKLWDLQSRVQVNYFQVCLSHWVTGRDFSQNNFELKKFCIWVCMCVSMCIYADQEIWLFVSLISYLKHFQSRHYGMLQL